MSNPHDPAEMDDDAAAGADTWELWRQDDNGNRFRIARFSSREAADAEQRRFEALAHKQTYRVERRDGNEGG
jgi:hypothetical protein